MTIKLMVFDIETPHLKADIFRLGKQVLSHNQLDPAYAKYDIISIAWTDNKTRKEHVLDWGRKGESKDMVLEFSKVIREYQDNGFIIFGKNNNRFDNKYINTLQWIHGAEPMPEWIEYVQDLETLMRKYFYFPSMSLDYASKLKGLGGKDKMEFADWQKIVRLAKFSQLEELFDVSALKLICPIVFNIPSTTIKRDGIAALHKMKEYNKKDVTDTMALLESMLPYFKIKNNLLQKTDLLRCNRCGGGSIKKNGKDPKGLKQWFYCKDCHTTAGYATIKKDGTFSQLK